MGVFRFSVEVSSIENEGDVIINTIKDGEWILITPPPNSLRFDVFYMYDHVIKDLDVSITFIEFEFDINVAPLQFHMNS